MYNKQITIRIPKECYDIFVKEAERRNSDPFEDDTTPSEIIRDGIEYDATKYDYKYEPSYFKK